MDTDSAYIALAGESIDDIVAPQHREHYFRHISEWLPADCCDKHEDDYVQTRLAGLPWTATVVYRQGRSTIFRMPIYPMLNQCQ